MKTIIYIDGFNLYYGCLKGNTDCKWLNLEALFSKILQSHNDIVEIKYFTARIKPTPNRANVRQRIYLRALEAYCPLVSFHYGYYSQHNVRMANANPPPNTVEVIKREEKGSDVNLSIHLLNDAWLNKFDCAIVVTNDSDMKEAMRLVREHHPNKIIGLITPGERTKTSRVLKNHANFVKKIRRSDLRASQLPELIPNSPLSKPPQW